MKKIIFILLIIVVAFSNCSKVVSNSSDPIVMVLDAAASNISVTASFLVNIKITSRIGNAGIKLESSCIDEVTGLSVDPQAPSFITSSADNSTSIINLPRQKWCVAYIKATDANDPKNTVTKNFRVIYK